MAQPDYIAVTAGMESGRDSRLPTIREILYSTVEDIELLLEERPQYRNGLAAILSTLISYECRSTGF
jgi:hypothetical protein